MRRLLLTLLTFSLLVSLHPLMAQKRRQAAPAAQASGASPDELIRAYRFADAARILQREVSKARTAGKSTVRLEADLARANMGTDFLSAVSRVTFIDSVKARRSDFLGRIRLSPEAGRLVYTRLAGTFAAPRPARLGQGAYVNDLGDRIVFSAADTASKPLALESAYRSGSEWAQAAALPGLADEVTDYDYPFLMQDGVTLYFSAQSDQSLGGYDLYVTRYDAESKRFLKAENLGMPFNSPANDYLLAIDETAQLGWLVSDRGQTGDTVCVYTFIPSDEPEKLSPDSCSQREILHAARIASIGETQHDLAAVKAAQARLAHVGTAEATGTADGDHFFVIDRKRVYTSLSQFRSDAARRIAVEAEKAARRVDALEKEVDGLCYSYAKGNRSAALKARLREKRDELTRLRAQRDSLYKNMRKAETE